MGTSEVNFQQFVFDVLDAADLISKIESARSTAIAEGRSQLLFSLHEAGLEYGVNLLLDHSGIVDQEFKNDLVDRSFDHYALGTHCVKEKLSRVVDKLSFKSEFDFILTTHDMLYYYDLKHKREFEGEVYE